MARFRGVPRPPRLATVLNRVDLRIPARPALTDDADLRRLLPRAGLDVSAAIEQVRPTVEAVRERGAPAVVEATARFDGVTPPSLRVPAAAIAAAGEALDPAVRAALGIAIERARLVHGAQRRTDVTTQVVPGGTVTQRWRPVSRLSATDCGDSFVFSAGEQEAWRLYSQGSERPWPPPKRCLPCRKALKVKRAGMLDVRGGG